MLSILLAVFLSVEPTQRAYDVTYINCYDGDTCEFNIHLGMGVVLAHQAIRFCDVNAPEIRPLITRVAGEKTRDALRTWISTAKVVKVWVPQETNCSIGTCDKKEKYGRWLGYVIADGVNLNEKLISSGLAVSYLSCK